MKENETFNWRLAGGWLRVTSLVSLIAAASLIAGCGGGNDSSAGDELTKVGKGEGELNLISWPGLTEDGSTDPKLDWVSGFEDTSGCQVNVKVGNTADEMVQLVRTGQYDGVTATGDMTLRLIESGDVDPVNTDLVPTYKDMFPGVQEQDYNSVDGQMYGIPLDRGANLLMWNTEDVKPAPNSWDVVFDKSDKYSGKVTALDTPIYIADAAVYLMAHRPELKITDPYELDDKQFDAAVELLKQQNENIGEYWSDYTKSLQAFSNGDIVVGETWPFMYGVLQDEGVPVKAKVPEREGATGWSDTWMISSQAKHPNCMYKWMNHVTSPQVQAVLVQYVGSAPTNSHACAPKFMRKGSTGNVNHCELFDADGKKYLDDLYYYKTPLSDCGDDRGAVCKTYADWVRAWTEIKG